MKKTAFAVVLFVIAVALAVVFLLPEGKRALHAGDLAPAETLLFFHLDDVQRSAARWPQTALAKIAAEPEVQAFFEKPRSKVPDLKAADEALTKIARLRVGEVFAAVTEIGESSAKGVAGFSFAGPPGELDALLAEMKNALGDAKTERVDYAGAEIETFAKNGTVVALTVRDGWCLVANDVDALQATLDRLGGKSAATSLAGRAQFKNALAPLPSAPDAEIYADVAALAARALPRLAEAGVTLPPEAAATLRRATAIAHRFKMDGAQFREATFALIPGGTAETPLPLHALALSTAATALVYASALPATNALPESAQSMLAGVPGFADFEKALAGAGMKPGELVQLVGPEFGAVLDWPKDDATPSFAFTFDVRDAAKARAAAQSLIAANGWTKSEHAGALILSQKVETPLAVLQPTIALAEKYAVLGLSPDAVNALLDRTSAAHERIDASATFQTAAKSVAPPTAGFAYVDLANIFTRTYGAVRPLALLALAFQPDAGQYLEAGKIPNTATIAQHLGPLVFSESTTAHGTLLESSGPLTLGQLGLLFGGAAAGLAASGELNPANLGNLGGLGLPIPGAKPAAPKTPALPTLPEPQ